MDEQTEQINSESDLRGFHWLIATPLTIWCLLWLAVNGYNYIYLTWHLFSELKWYSFALLLSPCFYFWLGLFSSSAWAPLNMLWMIWVKYDKDKDVSKTKVALMVIFIPVLLGLALQYIGPYFYPVTLGGESGTNVLIRLIPILGGRGYN